jgi:transposase InsO family protein
VQTFSGWVYTAFVMDLFARRVLGWQVADHLRSDLALDALEMAIWVRRTALKFLDWWGLVSGFPGSGHGLAACWSRRRDGIRCP